jgi:hypothetical protein
MARPCEPPGRGTSFSRFHIEPHQDLPIRLLEHERTEVGDEFPERLQEILNESLAMFETKTAEVEADFDYTVVPIKKLASVQLVTALHAMDYVQHHPEMAGWKKSEEPAFEDEA